MGGIVANNTYRAEFLYDNLMIQNNVIHNSYVHGVKKLLFLSKFRKGQQQLIIAHSKKLIGKILEDFTKKEEKGSSKKDGICLVSKPFDREELLDQIRNYLS